MIQKVTVDRLSSTDTIVYMLAAEVVSYSVISEHLKPSKKKLKKKKNNNKWVAYDHTDGKVVDVKWKVVFSVSIHSVEIDLNLRT